MNIKPGNKIKIVSADYMKHLGYQKDFRDIFQYADKVYTVARIIKRNEVKYYGVTDSTVPYMFIDADIAEVIKEEN